MPRASRSTDRRSEPTSIRPGAAAAAAAATGPGASSKGERTRQLLLAAAIARFGRDGYRATSLAEIARDARLSSTAAYPYFANKEALFVEAVDEDAAGAIEYGVFSVMGVDDDLVWLDSLLPSLVASLERHPLAHRVLAGLEPDFTVRLLRIPALERLRKLIADRILHQQHRGTARTDIDPSAMADGLVTIVLSLLMSLVQTKAESEVLAGHQVRAVLEAALTAPQPARRSRRRT